MGPFGLTYTQVLPLPGGTNQYYADMTWSPDSTQTGGNIICNIATDSNKMSSALSCFSVLVGGVGMLNLILQIFHFKSDMTSK